MKRSMFEISSLKKPWIFSSLTGVLVAGAIVPVASAQTDESYGVTALSDVFTHLVNEAIKDPVDADGWAPLIHPGSDWSGEWSSAGIEARYCAGNLLVYSGTSAKGAGTDLDQIRAVGFQLAGAGGRLGKTLDENTLIRGNGESVALPQCLNDAYTQPIPGGRVALFTTIDLQSKTLVTTNWNHKTVECPTGQHGSGSNFSQQVKTTTNYDGSTNTSTGIWEPAVSLCTDDYSYWDKFEQACSWTEGPPHNTTMYGINTYRVKVTVTASGETFDAPEFVSSTCFDVVNGKPAPIPAPTTTEGSTEETQTRDASCPSGYIGTITQKRKRTVYSQSVTFPWDQPSITNTRNGDWSEWQEVSNSCIQKISITANTVNYDIGTALRQRGWDGSRVISAIIQIEDGVVVGSSSVSGSALIVPGFPDGSNIKIINYGYIVGHGGNGAPDGGYPQAGGGALIAYSTVTIANYGIIGGGGGGGGQAYYGCGGGGAGYYGGARGGCSGSKSGTVITGGRYGDGSGKHGYGRGGSGGNLGQPGQSGSWDRQGSLAGAPGGWAVNGNVHIIWQVRGDIRGAIY